MTEDQLTAECFKAWDTLYPEHRGLLFHVPNGGVRNRQEANKFKAMGVVSGVSDFILLWNGSAYCIELKIENGVQSSNQEYWQYMVEGQGLKYYIIKSKQEFICLVMSIIGK